MDQPLATDVVLLVAGSCFAYYSLSLRMRSEQTRTTSPHRNAAWVTSLAVAMAVVTGFGTTGSPATERLT
jgi:cytochrome c oxidase assembly factor CtaG